MARGMELAAVGVRILGAVAPAHRGPRAVVGARAGRQALRQGPAGASLPAGTGSAIVSSLVARGAGPRPRERLTGMGREDDIDRLYGLPLAEFTAARNALAKELGGDEGKRVTALRKPSAAAGALNQAVRREPKLLRAFLEAADALREAHEALIGGGEREALDEATRRERAAAG